MFVKMTILRLLGSSDDKEKEKIGFGSGAPEEPMPLAGVVSVLPVTLRHEIAVELLTADMVITG